MKRAFSLLPSPFALLILSLALGAIGCSKTDSSDVKTSGIVADFNVQSDSPSWITCTAVFQVGGATGTYLELNGGDEVACNDVRMKPDTDAVGRITYSARLPSRAGDTYRIHFTRPGESYTASAILPEPVQVLRPSPLDNARKGESLVISWVPSKQADARMDVSLSYSYEVKSETSSGRETRYRWEALRDPAPEHGSVVFSSSQTIVSGALSGAYPAKLYLRRTLKGSTPNGLRASMSAVQETMVVFSLVD